MFRRNPLDTSGIICDFCGKSGVVHIFTAQPMMIGGIPRTQHMACPSCRDLILNRNIRALVTQAANMLPQAARRQARTHFSAIFTELLSKIVADAAIQPSHIFDLHMLRARQKRTKCALRFKPICTDLAFVMVSDSGWKPACLPCAAKVLGSDDPTFIVGHPQIKTLRRRNPTPDDWDAIQREGEKEHIKQYGGLCENCDGLLSVCEVCDEVTCDCKKCSCDQKQRRYNPDEEIRRTERDSLNDPLFREKAHHQHRRAAMPIHDHNCDGCVFLGSVSPERYSGHEVGCHLPGQDLYFCPESGVLGGSLIVRNSCLDSDYASMPLDVYLTNREFITGRKEHYAMIYQLAQERGLIK